MVTVTQKFLVQNILDFQGREEVLEVDYTEESVCHLLASDTLVGTLCVILFNPLDNSIKKVFYSYHTNGKPREVK